MLAIRSANGQRVVTGTTNRFVAGFKLKIMANPEHVKWLLEGVDSWNQRRDREDFKPDLSDVDIYEEFQKARKLAADGSIQLSQIILNDANLSGSCFEANSDIIGANLTGANFSFANLQRVNLTNARLEGADFCSAVLDEATLHKANLCGAEMHFTQCNRTEFYQANLTNTNFDHAVLENALFISAILVNTDFSSAKLTGVNLEWSRLWKANLFQISGSESKPFISESHGKHINCVADLIKECTEHKTNDSDDVLYYRGERKKEWELRPSVMRRSEKTGRHSLLPKESDMLLELMSQRPEDFNDVPSALAQWVLAQHHGLKTRLLDVTRNPLVALFSACEKQKKHGRLHVFSVPKKLIKPFNSDTISILANFCKLTRPEQISILGLTAKDVKELGQKPTPPFILNVAMDRLYHLIQQEKPNFKERIDPRDFFRVFVVEPQQSFARIRTQSGAFLISALHERFEQSEVLKKNPAIPIYSHFTIEVPKESKQDILDELRMLNVTRETLFPGLDTSAEAITENYSS